MVELDGQRRACPEKLPREVKMRTPTNRYYCFTLSDIVCAHKHVVHYVKRDWGACIDI